jgi:hypothetical protein
MEEGESSQMDFKAFFITSDGKIEARGVDKGG